MNPSMGTDAPPTTPWKLDFVLLAAIWGASFLFMRLAALEFGALPTAAIRVAIAAAFLLPLLWMRGLATQLLTHWRRLLVVGVLNSAIPFACYSYALLHITTGLSSVLNATVPLFGALVAWLWLKDRPGGLKLLGLAIGFSGVALLASGKASFKSDASGVATGWAVMACLLATLCYGIAASYTKRWLTGIPALVTATGSQVGATVALALPALWLWPTQAPSAQAWLAVSAVGVLCTGVAYVLFFRLIAGIGPARALTVTFMVPVFAIGYGVLLLGEGLTLLTVVCGAIILLGTSLSTGLVHLPDRPKTA